MGLSSSSTYSIVGLLARDSRASLRSRLLELLTLTGALSTGNKTLLLSTDDDDELDCVGVSIFLTGSLLPLNATLAKACLP